MLALLRLQPAPSPRVLARAFSAAAQQDVVIVGGGPGGYVAAIKAAQLGLKVTCVEKRGSLGGTCLNVGCIPSKALLHSSHMYEQSVKEFSHHGIDVGSVSVNLPNMLKQKEGAVTGLTKGIEGLFAKNKVTYAKGYGKLAGANSVHVDMMDGSKKIIDTKNIIIAAGSEPIELPFLKFDEKVVVSSTGALSLTKIPKKMVLIGAGVIGLELGSVWRRLGAEVEVIEFGDRVCPGMDTEIAANFAKYLAKQGMKFRFATKVKGASVRSDGVTLIAEPVKGGADISIDADVVLVAIGRRPRTEEMELEKFGVKLDERKRVVVGEHLQTSVKGIYAIGDCIAGPMLAHKAEEEGIAVAEHLAGKHGHVNYDVIPGVVYTHPEVASVGKTEEELKAAGIAYKKGVFPFLANSRARSNGDSDGMVKFLTDAKTDKVLGCHMIGSNAGEAIAEACLAMEYGASCEDIARTCHAHPTLSEAVKEAAMAAYDKPIHM
jgi:dihydrolipoamide dehydrogenase